MAAMDEEDECGTGEIDDEQTVGAPSMDEERVNSTSTQAPNSSELNDLA